ncbi:acetyl-CoA hydrolase/transferase family protein [Candidatus Xianfuyuplasma coldseepsis]|uniref:4-hydroxybutyrate--acetyl-CoA CoA transferase n=1 Tax=Candidatus Xianfuyuplasma coldseepsis TaxID=2782163 RepID=A0A7L7KTF1_9MOLU|nr:acetyl-CoA hydrolase/transferase C-terminal domain-containing protein [Xianfuyuplasma coldseepsis]QMS85977.1 4-hydroxybutyrate--acetyl-CoA CoA transferase [Xianfuyuplasma coldseepsis]
MAKIITINEALNLVQEGDHIVAGMAASEGREFFTKLHEVSDRIEHITIDNCLPMYPYEFMVNDQYKDHFTVNSWFFSGDIRKAFRNGNIAFIPNQLHFAGVRRIEHKKPNIYVGNCTLPDKHGFVSLSLSNVYEKKMLEAADTVILEINPHFPRTLGDLEVHQSDIDYFVKVDYLPPELPDTEPNEKDLKIGELIASYIHDGDTIQLGIGGIPNAVANALMDKKDLGVHTEMLTTGFMKLFKAGAVTNKKKTLHNGKMVAAFALGTPELYDFIDDNPGILLLDGNYVNDPCIIGQNDNQVSINTTIEVDLTGQCCSESIGTRQFSGTGGQTDTATGAQRAKNGRSFIALYSTTKVRDKETGERIEVSKIVPTLKPGAAVSLSRNDVDYIVTEYGAVRLRGTSIKERVELLISVAHPKFRDELRQQAKEIGYIE